MPAARFWANATCRSDRPTSASMIEEIRCHPPRFHPEQPDRPYPIHLPASLAELGPRRPAFRPETCPVLSCNLTECELPAIGDAAEGLIAAGPYFRFAAGQPQPGRFGSAHEASAHAAARMLARLLNGRPGAESLPISALLTEAAAAGIGVDPRTHHTELPVLIGQVRAGRFEVIRDFGRIAGDPWLTPRPRPARPGRRAAVVP